MSTHIHIYSRLQQTRGLDSPARAPGGLLRDSPRAHPLHLANLALRLALSLAHCPTPEPSIHRTATHTLAAAQ